MSTDSIIGKNLEELEVLVETLGYGKALGGVLATNLYRRRVANFDLMDNLPKPLRLELAKRFSLQPIPPTSSQTSDDGMTKYTFRTSLGNPFEMAYMPGPKRSTLCISTQSGCRVGCSFCYTGKLGLLENLTATDIIGQVMVALQQGPLNRIVLMGMGEPLDNCSEVVRTLEILNAPWGMAFGARRITLSTTGMVAPLESIVGLGFCNIAISMHSPFPQQRAQLVPLEEDHPLLRTINYFRRHSLKQGLRLSFEYVVLPGENDSQRHIAETARLLGPLNCHLNVIPLNTPHGAPANHAAARKFQKALVEIGLPATIRTSRGADINAACGMMAGKTTPTENTKTTNL